MPKSADFTVRDFSGGWNTADNEFNLKTTFLSKCSNVIIGYDNSMEIRPGYKLAAYLDDGTESAVANNSFTFTTTNTSPIVTVTRVGHGLNSGDHFHILTWGANLGGLTADDFIGIHGVRKVDNDNFTIVLRKAATSTAGSARSIDWKKDDHTLAGKIIDGTYFQDYLLLFSEMGEIARMAADGTVERIWDISIAYSRAGNPVGWRKHSHVSFTAANKTLLVVNGYSNDKPIEIDNTRANVVEFLVDPASGSNADVPRGNFIFAMNTYVVILGSDNDADSELTISISDQGTTGVFATNASPGDSVDINLGAVTTSVDPKITGVGKIRDRMVVTFGDSAMLIRLGIYSGSVHEPDLSDTISAHGSVSHRAIQSLGNDMLMADIFGVPSVALSQVSSTFVPTRVSDNIGNDLERAFDRISDEARRNGVFSVYDSRNKQYMLFIPKYDEEPVTLLDDPIILAKALGALQQAVVYKANHQLLEGSYVTLAGLTDIGGYSATNLNGKRKITAVIDDNFFVIETGAVYSINAAGGGNSATYTPVNDESIGYIYQANPQKGARRWMEFRGLPFTWGCVSLQGRLFFGNGLRVYKLGSNSERIHADAVGDFDIIGWANSTAYTAGQRLVDGTTIYECSVSHTSSASGTFANELLANPGYWEPYTGRTIKFEAETPWSDLRSRDQIKNIRHSRLDAKGTGGFKFEIYTDKRIYNQETLVRIPQIAINFVADDAGGYGQSSAFYGGGRSTREPMLWSTPVRGNLFKLRWSGETKEHVEIIAATMFYLIGGRQG